MTLSTLVFTYILGGLTFLPLLLIAIVVPGWLLLPEVTNEGKASGNDDKSGNEEEKEPHKPSIPEELGEVGSSGTFAVLRKYDFQAALAALNARHNSAGAGGTTAGTEASGETGTGSESVYQSMYRSVFDRSKAAASNPSILDNEDEPPNPGTTRGGKRPTPANVFYIVLRHAHLMLYDSNAEREVRHVISLAHYNISLASGPYEPDEREMKDSELFIKRTAIVLTPKSSKRAQPDAQHSQPQTQAKPFYLFSTTCIEKEDFYHALLSTRNPRPIPQPLDTESIIKLQSTLHSSSSLTPETRAINAIISRIFLALHQTDRLKNIVRNKIEKKISRVQKPAFIASLAVQSIDLGDAAPVISNGRLQDLHIGGDMTIAFDVRYTGGVKVTVAALAKLDLGPRFKTRTADLLLSTSLQRLHGHMLVRIKASPSNRIWFCFETIPEMEIKVEPVVSQRQITYTFILRAIEDRIRTVVGETLVKPNWDDVAFLDTREERWRGGIWSQESGATDPAESPTSDLRKRHQKTMSMPSLVNGATEADSSSASSGSEAASKFTTGLAANDRVGDLKRRSVNSLPSKSASEREAHTPPPPPKRPLRTPSFTSPSASAASVKLDESPANVEPLRADTAQELAQQQKKWRIRPAPQQPSTRKDAIESIREMRDRSFADRDAEDEVDGAMMAEPSEMEGGERRRSSESPAPSLMDRSLRQPRRVDTNASTSSSATTRSQRQQEAVQKGKTILAATAAATTAAKNWSWSAIANRTAKGGRAGAQGEQQEPLGRGQPLPPPGMPLPGPQKGWLPSGVGMASVKRKPVQTPRASLADITQEQLPRDGSDADTARVRRDEQTGDAAEQDGEMLATPASEFGPWRENSGAGFEDSREPNRNEYNHHVKHDTATGELQGTATSDLGEASEAAPERKIPPPLPARRQSTRTGMETAASADVTGTKNQSRVHDTPTPPAAESDVPSDHKPLEVNDLVQTESESAAYESVPNPRAIVPTSDAADDFHSDQENIETKTTEVRPADVDISDTDDLVAIPAPADDDADEAQLEEEGVQEK